MITNDTEVIELLTIPEAARLLRVAPITVRRFISDGRLSAVRVGKGVRVRREALKELIVPVEPKTPKAAKRAPAGR